MDITPSKLNRQTSALLILGMHRSGTSAMAKVCSLLGVHLGDRLAPPNADNIKGFFEDLRITDCHERLLNSLGVSWDFAGLLPENWLHKDVVSSCRKQLATIALSLAEDRPLWGFKDPRLSRLLPLWGPVFQSLECTPYCIIMVRNPLEVAASLERRNGITLAEAIWLWVAYTIEAERFSRPYPRCFIHYEQLLSKPEQCVSSIANRFDLAWPKPFEQIAEEIAGFLEPSLRHHEFDEQTLANTEISGMAKELYTLLLGETRHELALQSQFDELYGAWYRLMCRFAASQHEQEVEKRLLIDLDRLSKQNEDLNARYQSSHRELMQLSDWATGLKQSLEHAQGENTHLKQQFETKHEELMRMSDWATSMKQQLESQYRELMQISDWASGMKQDLSRVQSELEAKHSELMKMSDWASDMKQRLDEIDRSYLMWPAKRMMRLEYRARGKVNQWLAHPVLAHWKHRRHYRRNLANYPLLRASTRAKNGKLLVVFPIITWDFRWQRPQHIVSRLSAHGFAVLYLAMSIASKGKPYQSMTEAGIDIGFNELSEHIHQVWLYSNKPTNIYTDFLREDDLANLLLGLKAALQAAEARNIYYLVQFPGWTPLALALREQFAGPLVFDCMDDHSGFSTNTDEALKLEETLIQQADLVIASSSLLEDKLKVLNSNTILVKNGTEFEHFQRPEANGELDHYLGKPIIGYYGAISDWFDMELLVYCARQKPDWQFVLIGSTFGCDTDVAKEFLNIKFLGEKPYAELPGYLAYFDVCTIPFKIVPLTLATNPVKFYEYLSSGRPVVAVDLPELQPYRDNCYLAKDKDEFLQQLAMALAQKDDPELIARRIALAKGNSWDQRVETILRHPVFERV